MTIDVVKEEQLCSLGDEAEALLKTEAYLILFLLTYYGYAPHKLSVRSQLNKKCRLKSKAVCG